MIFFETSSYYTDFIYEFLAANSIAFSILLYEAHLQILPCIASLISSLVGEEFSFKNAEAVIIWPAWQYPHWGTSISFQASWTGWVPLSESPSIVVIDSSFNEESVIEQLLTATLFTWTVHAPHWAIPQPNFVPTRFSSSLKTQRRGVSLSTFTIIFLPLMFSV